MNHDRTIERSITVDQTVYSAAAIRALLADRMRLQNALEQIAREWTEPAQGSNGEALARIHAVLTALATHKEEPTND